MEQCLTGSDLAYSLDTNTIIKTIYKNIPDTYKEQYRGIIDIDEAGNPLYY